MAGCTSPGRRRARPRAPDSRLEDAPRRGLRGRARGGRNCVRAVVSALPRGGAPLPRRTKNSDRTLLVMRAPQRAALQCHLAQPALERSRRHPSPAAAPTAQAGRTHSGAKASQLSPQPRAAARSPSSQFNPCIRRGREKFHTRTHPARTHPAPTPSRTDAAAPAPRPHAAAATAWACGRRITKEVAHPGASSTPMLPPCASTHSLQK